MNHTAEAITPKGSYLPLNQFANDVDTSDQILLVPSWTSGVFPPLDDWSSEVDCSEDTVPTKRRKKSHNDARLSHQTSLKYGNLERLIAHEIRGCDVCGRQVLRKPSSHQDKSAETSTEAKSIAERLPQFIEKYISSQPALQCSYCVKARALNVEESYPFCGTVYCCKDCQNGGEAGSSLQSPKFFFCRNRAMSNIKSAQQDGTCVKEAIHSLNAIRQRLKSICGVSTRTSHHNLQPIGLEECAMLITTVACCSSHWIVSEILQLNSNINDTIQNVNIDASEEDLIEELWVMSQSYCSVLQSIDQSTDSNAKSNNSQQFFSRQVFAKLYAFIKRYCVIRVSPSSHPLISYTTKTLLSSKELNDADRNCALDALQVPLAETDESAKNTDLNIQSAIGIWRRCTHFSHWLSSSSSQQHEDVHTKVRAQLNKTYYAFSHRFLSKLKHSCAPTLLLTMKDDKASIKSDDDYHDKNLAWLTLHDLSDGEESISRIGSLDTDVNSRRLELGRLFGSKYVCKCERCQHERSGDNGCFTTRQLKRLGDVAMQQSRFEDAVSIYEAILNIDSFNADAFHAKAAAFLGRASSVNFAKFGHCQGLFVQSQKLWSQAAANDILAKHTDVSVILQKQKAYGTIQNHIGDTTHDANQKSLDDQYETSSYLNKKVFLANAPVISLSECRQVIKSAESYAKLTGWTTSRHYSVPTTDIPLHELTDLQPWFYKVWTQRIRPLLRHQLNLNTATVLSKARDIFIHDAFVVRYDASGGQRNLPPHYDESTHSFLVALNSDYEGGGTYIHALQTSLKPAVPGGMISFCGGEILHSGDSVVRGTRYVIVAFCYVDLISNNHDEKKATVLQITGQESDTSSRFSFGFSF